MRMAQLAMNIEVLIFGEAQGRKVGTDTVVTSPLTSFRSLEAAMRGRQDVEDMSIPCHWADKCVVRAVMTRGNCRLRRGSSRVVGESNDRSLSLVRHHRYDP